MKKRVGILISGRGSNMAALIEAARAPDYPAEIVLVISNRPDAAGLERARAAGIEAVVIDHKGFASREAFDGAVEEALLGHGVDLVCHAGFMRIQSEAFAARWTGRQLNIHPSLLPSFRGLKPQQQALDAGVRISGCSGPLRHARARRRPDRCPGSRPGAGRRHGRHACRANPDCRAQALSPGAAAGCGRRGQSPGRQGRAASRH